MAEAKVNQPPAEPQPLSPYRHELNTSGTACAEDCPACQWFEQPKMRLGANLPEELENRSMAQSQIGSCFSVYGKLWRYRRLDASARGDRYMG
jgi:hypothetical protein